MNTSSNVSTTRTGIVAEGAEPLVASAFVAGIVYLWTAAILRLLGTFGALPAAFALWQDRAGDIAAMWLTMSVVGLGVFFVLGFLVFRGRSRVGSIRLWTILLIVSAIAAPLIAEIGTPIGI